MNILPALILVVLPCLTLWGQEADPMLPPAAVTLSLWPEGKMPGPCPKGPERVLPSRGDHVRRVTDVTDPRIAVYPAPDTTKPAPAIIVCPGGAYQILSADKEGIEIATWFSQQGIIGIVLTYRVPNCQDGAFQDIQRAIRLVRSHAQEWHVDPARIGVMGSSAGGHLCARIGTDFATATYPRLDGADDLPLRPDAMVLLYPAYLNMGAATKDMVSRNLPISAAMPPTFIIHSDDDAQFITGSRAFLAALDKTPVVHGSFILPTGGHGYGLRNQGPIRAWPEQCLAWLITIGFH